MKKSLFLLLGLVFIPNVSFWYSYYSYFSSTTVTLKVNTTVNIVMPQTLSCYNDSMFLSMPNYLKYLDQYELNTAEQRLNDVKEAVRIFNSTNYYTTSDNSAYVGRYKTSTTTSFNSSLYNSQFESVCNAQQRFIEYVWEKYNEKVKEFNDILNRIWTNLQKWDEYANKWDYSNARKSYNAAIPDLEKLWWMENVIEEIEKAIDDMNAKSKLEEALKDYQELTEKYKDALIKGRDEYYDAAISELEQILKNEWTIEWDYYDEAKDFLEKFKTWKALYQASLQAKQEEEQAQAEKKIEDAKAALWSKAAIFEWLVPLFKQKDEDTQNKVKALLTTFESSKDTYTRNIGIYFWHLIK